MTHDFPTIPPFSSLTPADHPSHPYSVWAEPTPASSPSAPDPLGKLRLLTPAVVALAAKEEIRTGLRVSLDLTISTNAKTVGGRAVPERHVVRIDGGPATEEDAKARGEVYQPVHDDIVHFNTQAGTQWDGFHHFSYPGGLFYGGTTSEDVFNGKISDGMAAWAEAGGIMGRGVLIDYARWAEEKGIVYDACCESHAVPVAVIREIAADKGVTFRVGDILFLRTGFESRFDVLVAQGLHETICGHYPGLEQGEDTLRFLWDSGFAAVAGDQPSFERWPAPIASQALHPICLSGWGLPFGELFSLNKVADECAKQGRSTFFLSAVPLKVEQGLASLGNAVAIF